MGSWQMTLEECWSKKPAQEENAGTEHGESKIGSESGFDGGNSDEEKKMESSEDSDGSTGSENDEDNVTRPIDSQNSIPPGSTFIGSAVNNEDISRYP